MKTKLKIDVSAADAVWLSTAILHREHPRKQGFTVQEIVRKVEAEQLTTRQPMTIYQHANQHCVANRPPNNARLRMLTETPDGLRRLYRSGDPVDPQRTDARALPDADSLGENYKYLLDWYRDWVANNPADTSADPLLALMGTWTFGDADRYVRHQRAGWDARP